MLRIDKDQVIYHVAIFLICEKCRQSVEFENNYKIP